MKFEDLELHPPLLKSLERMGYEELTPIQEQTFTHILAGRDMLATAETGSGKTSACGIPIIQNVDPHLNAIQALVIVPTRELALQYVEEITRIAHYLDISTFAVYGGFSMEVQKAKLQAGVHILVATTGRLIDLLNYGYVSLANVRTLILDEADEMLKLGFLEDIDFVFSCMLHEHQTLLFSATMPAEIKGLAHSYLKDPVSVELNVEQRAPQSLEHHFLFIKHPDKVGALLEYLEKGHVSQAIVFCNTRTKADKLYQQLNDRHAAVELIHGGLEQSKRSSIIRRFRKHQINIMVATDLAGRGLDFMNVTHIINFDFPQTPVVYTHRTGRAGRMGRDGVALTLVTHHELRSLRHLLDSNRIEPVWVGEKPERPSPRGDGRHPENHSRGGGRGRSSYRERPRSGETRTGPAPR